MQRQVIRLKDVIREYELSHTTIWRKNGEGAFPQKLRLGSRNVGCQTTKRPMAYA